jgi:hypothetical protein
MDATGHKDSAERIMHTMDKLGADDYEMVIEGAMLATAGWINFALHTYGVTDAADDVMHTYFLTGNQWKKYGIVIEDMLQALEEIENVRPMYVRGDVPGGEKVAARARELAAFARERALAAKPLKLYSG